MLSKNVTIIHGEVKISLRISVQIDKAMGEGFENGLKSNYLHIIF